MQSNVRQPDCKHNCEVVEGVVYNWIGLVVNEGRQSWLLRKWKLQVRGRGWRGLVSDQ